MQEEHRVAVRPDLRLAVAEDPRGGCPRASRPRRECRPPRSRDGACRRRDCAPGSAIGDASPSGSISSTRMFGRSTNDDGDAVLGQRQRLGDARAEPIAIERARRPPGPARRSRHGSAGRASRASVADLRRRGRSSAASCPRSRRFPPRTARRTASRTSPASRRRGFGSESSASSTASSTIAWRRLALAIGGGQAEQRDRRILQHVAAVGEHDGDADDAGEAEPAPLADAALLVRARAAGRRGRAGRASRRRGVRRARAPGGSCGRCAPRSPAGSPAARASFACSCRCSASPCTGIDDLRLHPVVELAQLVAARMARGVDQRVAVGDDLGAEIDQRVDDGVHRALVAGDGARGEDDAVARRRAPRSRWSLGGDAGKRRPRLALAAGHQRHDLVARQVAVGAPGRGTAAGPRGSRARARRRRRGGWRGR